MSLPTSYSAPYPDAGNSSDTGGHQTFTPMFIGDVFVLVAGCPSGDGDIDECDIDGEPIARLSPYYVGPDVTVAIFAAVLTSNHAVNSPIGVNGPASMSWMSTVTTPADGVPVLIGAAADGGAGSATVSTGTTGPNLWALGLIGDGEPDPRDPTDGTYLHDIGGVPWDAGIAYGPLSTTGQTTSWGNAGRIGLGLVVLPIASAPAPVADDTILVKSQAVRRSVTGW